MKKCNLIVLLFIYMLLSSSNCSKEGLPFLIQNNSDKEIIVAWSDFSIGQDTLCIKLYGREYQNFIRDRMIKPHSSKNFEKIGLAESMISRPNDIFYIAIFYRADMDSMSCEEFKQAFPLKKEWEVTLSDMEACDWTLVYTE